MDKPRKLVLIVGGRAMAHKVGGEVDAFCTRCKMTLAHTVLAMVGTQVARVRCNTCQGDHAFRQGAPGHSPARVKSTSPPKEKILLSFEAQLAGKDPSKARRYSPKETFAVDEVINHPSFGLGIVRAVRGEKIEVAFKAMEKTLAQKRGEGSLPIFHPPKPQSDAPSDKPTSEATEATPSPMGEEP